MKRNGNWRPVVASAQEIAETGRALFTNFDAAFDKAPHRYSINIAGRNVAIASDLPDQTEIYERALAGQSNIKTTPDLRILVAGTGGLPGMAHPPVWEDHEFNDRRMCLKFADTALRVHHFRERDFWQFYCKETRCAVQWMATPRSLPAWDAGSPLRNILNWDFSHDAAGFVHAGTLGVAGRGIMMAGPGGSGKSGTVLSGLLHRLESVGDDYVFAECQTRPDGSDTVAVRPIFNTMKTDTKGLKRLGIGLQGDTNWQGKLQFTFQDLIRRDPEPQLSIGALCVPHITGGTQTSFEKMTRQQAFLALAKTAFQQMPGDPAGNFALCSRITKALPTFALKLGTDPEEVANAIREFITEGPLECA